MWCVTLRHYKLSKYPTKFDHSKIPKFLKQTDIMMDSFVQVPFLSKSNFTEDKIIEDKQQTRMILMRRANRRNSSVS